MVKKQLIIYILGISSVFNSYSTLTAAEAANKNMSDFSTSHQISPLDEDTIHELFHWIEDHISEEELKVDGAMPDVKHVSHDELVHVAFGANYRKLHHPERIQIYGLYNFIDGTIYLVDTIDITTEKGKAILLHELIHYLQYHNHLEENAACMKQLERLAYSVEAEHLEEHHTTPDFNQSFIDKVSQCE